MASKPSKRKAFLYLKILEEYSHGLSYRQIANKLGISTWQCNRVLTYLNEESKQELRDYVSTTIPLQFRATVTLLRSVMSTAHEIVEKSVDPRVKLMALTLEREANQEINLTLIDAAKVSKAIDKITQSNESVMQKQIEHSSAAAQLVESMKDMKHTSHTHKDSNIDGRDNKESHQ